MSNLSYSILNSLQLHPWCIKLRDRDYYYCPLLGDTHCRDAQDTCVQDKVRDPSLLTALIS